MILVVFLMMLPPLMAFCLFEIGFTPKQVIVFFLALILIPHCYMIHKAISHIREGEDDGDE